MSTTLSEINDLFLTRISDYRIDAIYVNSGSTVLNTYLEPWALDSIVEFNDICTQNLDYVPTSGSVDGYFNVDLTLENKVILSQIMVIYWLEKNVNDILQMNIHVTDKDFKTFSTSQNLKAKQDYLNTQREIVSQKLVDYGYRHQNFSNWRSQIFYT